MKTIKMIDDVQELKGTCYVEVQPGRYTGEFWSKDSVYFTDEVFGLFSQAIHQYAPAYSLWGVTKITADTWLLIAEELNKLADFLHTYPEIEDIETRMTFVYEEENKKDFVLNQKEITAQIIDAIQSFVVWIKKTCQTHSSMTILGV